VPFKDVYRTHQASFAVAGNAVPALVQDPRGKRPQYLPVAYYLDKARSAVAWMARFLDKVIPASIFVWMMGWHRALWSVSDAHSP
jgi:hypothetical protein